MHRVDSYKPKIEIFFGETQIEKYEPKCIQTEEPFMLGWPHSQGGFQRSPAAWVQGNIDKIHGFLNSTLPHAEVKLHNEKQLVAAMKSGAFPYSFSWRLFAAPNLM